MVKAAVDSLQYSSFHFFFKGADPLRTEELKVTASIQRSSKVCCAMGNPAGLGCDILEVSLCTPYVHFGDSVHLERYINLLHKINVIK